MKDRRLFPQPIMDESLLLTACREHNIKSPAHHAKGLWQHMCKHSGGLASVRDVPDLPERMYRLLETTFAPFTTTVVTESPSSDGSTIKLLIKLQDDHLVESVIMRYGGEGQRASNRATLCVSSQVGCKMGCTFCATGTMGLSGNLTAGEILEQLMHANRVLAPTGKRIRNIVFMGMGEPLDNYDSVRDAVRAMCDPNRFGLAWGHVTVSTVGVVDRMRQMRVDMPLVNLALSLHAPTQESRWIPELGCGQQQRGLQLVVDHLLRAQRDGCRSHREPGPADLGRLRASSA